MTRALSIVLFAVLSASAPALAQQTPLQQAEAAYQDVDFEGTYRHALAALRAGGQTPEQLVRTYQLLGIAASALRREDDARDYFVRMLGLDPDAELDSSVPPRLRDPYLEARGVWAARTGRLGIRVELDRPRSLLRIELTDPTVTARRVVVHSRLEGAAQFVPQDVEARTAIEVAVQGATGADRVEYFVEILDEHRNVMRSEGTAFQPRVVGRERIEGGGAQVPGGGTSIFEEPALWIIVGVVLAAGAATTIGIVADQRSRIGVQSSVTIGIDI